MPNTSRPCIALVAMPWYSVWVPSVQLAVLRQCLSGFADVDSYELYVDYAATISTSLYDPLSGGGEFVEEWLFAQHYFRGEGIDYPGDIEAFGFPPLGLGDPRKDCEILQVLADVSGDYLERMLKRTDWDRYDIVGFTLGIAQTSASMALAALIKRAHPHIQIIFGGSACEGEQAKAILGICPHVDVIVRGQAEGIVEPLVQRLAGGLPFEDLPNLTYRGPEGNAVETPHKSQPTSLTEHQIAPEFDEYLARMERYHLRDNNLIMLPFESSRGCWWGEKSQCTFCGLAEDMRYRARGADEVLAELDELYARYGISRFFAMDLIMPQAFYKDFLPRVRASDRPYWFFYELKANLTREQVALLSGLVHVQPGLESLSSRVLQAMKKGLTAAQNIQFLKWCAEYGVQIFSWHLIVGMPGESAEDNDRVADAVPTLYHLQPPHFAYFELHRFSPIHRNPQYFGLSQLRPVRTYEKIFPVRREMLDDLVYRFEYRSEAFDGQVPPWMMEGTADLYGRNLREAVHGWNQEWDRGATFSIEFCDAGGAILCDSRLREEPVQSTLDPDEASLYDFLDSVRVLRSLPDLFGEQFPEVLERLGGSDEVMALVEDWISRGWVFEEADRVIGLAVYAVPRPAGTTWRRIPPSRRKTRALAAERDTSDITDEVHLERR